MTNGKRESDEEKKGFRVVDRRSFAQEAQSTGASSARPTRAELPAEEPPAVRGPSPRPSEPLGALPEIDFSTFLLSLSTSALYHLGQVREPDGTLPPKDLPLAKQTIDILGMLQAKTRGNLTAEEAQLLENLLYDLRLRYVNAARS